MADKKTTHRSDLAGMSTEDRREYDDLAVRFAILDRILEARIAKGWSQADLARAVGRHKQSITRFESGVQDPRLSTLVAVCDALGIPLAEVVGAADQRSA